MRRTPVPGMLKTIVFVPLAKRALLSRMACRSEPGSASFTFVTVNVVGAIVLTKRTPGENSEVFPAASVAVAVTNRPTGALANVTLKLRSPLFAVVMVVAPRCFWPSP